MLIKREMYLSRMRNYYDSELIKIITGIRRSGKSIILKQIIDELKSTGVDEDHIIYLNFEDFDFEYINTASQLNEYVKIKITDGKKYYMFFDEIQHVSSFEKAIASFKATKNCSIFVTGSNSQLLSGEMATLLVGRTIEFKVFPFTFQEMCDYLNTIGKKADDSLIFDYIKWGGFPQRFEFSNEHEIKNYLDSVFQGIVSKDILKINSNIESNKFRTICSYVMANAGKEFSAKNIVNFYNSVNNNNKKAIDPKTIYSYLDKMEKAFFISRVKRFNISGKEVLKTIEKQYAVDTGLRTINTNLMNFEDTFFLENIIYNELIIRGYEVYTGKTYKGEVDFVAQKDLKKYFIQVSYYLINQETIEREFQAFDPIKDASPKIVLSLDKIDMSHDGIIHLNIVDFLLGRKNFPMS